MSAEPQAVMKEVDESPVGPKARRRSWFCPGAGYALLGRHPLAITTFVVSLSTFAAIAWLALEPSGAAFWAAVAAIGIATVLWIVEQLAVNRLRPRAPRPRFLVGGFLFATAAMGLAAAIVLVLLLTRFGSLQMAGGGMCPTLEKGERLLYHEQVQPERLRRGAVILYKLSPRSAWGQPGMLVVSRILAVPGNRLSIRGGQYLIDGKVVSAVAETGQLAPVIQVPLAPATLTVPDNSYFVVQDSPQDAYDSRVLSWVEIDDVVSTRLYYLSGRGIFKPVE